MVRLSLLTATMMLSCEGMMFILISYNSPPKDASVKFHLSCDVSLSDPFDGVIPKCLDVSVFVMFVVWSKIILIGADMNSHSQVSNPHAWFAD